MAYANVERGWVMVDEADLGGPSFFCDLDERNINHAYGSLEWHGPIYCPGGDFGQETVLLAEETIKAAQEDGAVVVLEHYDFRFAAGRGETITKVRLTSVADIDERAFSGRDENE
jgi:hypothetical protein